MATIRSFKAYRPAKEVVDKVAALPYDVYDRKEAKEVALANPLSFLNIDRPETQFPDDFDMYSPDAYKKASEMLTDETEKGIFVQDVNDMYYLYELTMNGRSQTGIVACASVSDYVNNIIKKHENTRADKELDRINHVDICSAQTGPIFLAYRKNETIEKVVAEVKKDTPAADFISDDGIGHRVWTIADREKIKMIGEAFKRIDSIYIADGHHRAASAVKVGLKRREEETKSNGSYDENAEYNYFLSVLFPENELMIMPYNRVVKDLNGRTEDEFLSEISVSFDVVKVGTEPVSPKKKYEVGMFLAGNWYRLNAKDEIKKTGDPVASLDVSVLQDHLLSPVLGISDPKTDSRIDFVGGIRGLGELERRCSIDMKVAFSMYPTAITELFAVSDAGLLMPPKSTWFEPKLRSGLFIHKF